MECGVIFYLLYERLQCVQTAWRNTFYIYFVFGIITISTTRVDFVCLGFVYAYYVGLYQ